MKRFRWAHLCFGAVLLAVYPLATWGQQAIIYLLLSISAPVAIVIALRVHKPARRKPWIILGAGLVCYLVGDSVCTWYEQTGDQVVPFPNIGDAAYLMFYPIVFVAMMSFLRAAGHRDRAAWLDAAMWTVGGFLLAWEPFIEASFAESIADPLAGTVGLAYPLMDIALLLVVFRMVAGGVARTPAYWLLLLGLCSQTASDVVYSLQIAQGIEPSWLWLSTGWMFLYVAIGAAVLHPSMTQMTEPSQARPLSSRFRLVMLIIPTMMAPGLLVYQLSTGQLATEWQDGVVIAAGTSLLMFLAFARAFGLFSFAERRTEQLVARQAQLEAVLVDRERSTSELSDRVNQDFLTGLASRDRFVAALDTELNAGNMPSIAFLDLDDFKTINDTLGHDAGDLLLIELAHRLQATVGPADLVARFGGDEFAALVTGGNVEEVAESMIESLRLPVQLHGRELRLQVSIGVTTATVDEQSTSDMLRRADLAMYTAKRSGGGWARYRTGMSALLREQMDLRARLARGLRNAEIEPWFQPVVDITTGELRGFEALARWMTGPDRSILVATGAWLPMAEETGLIETVDRVVSRAAIRQLSTWRDRFDVDDLYLAINMSARTLQQRGIAEDLIAMLAEFEVPAHRIVVEVTEGVLIDDERVSTRLQLLRGAGIRVALDDFGTGWSSLTYLQRFPVDQLKLDCSFTTELGLLPGGEAIPAAVIQLARALSLDVVAEGVETLEQLDRLIDLGFVRAQGFLLGQAEPAERFDELLGQARPQLSALFTPVKVTRPMTATRRGSVSTFTIAGGVPANPYGEVVAGRLVGGEDLLRPAS